MKELADGTKVNSRGYYFLLDWKDQIDNNIIYDLYGQARLCDTNKKQYIYLMELAMADELESIKNAT